MKIVAREAIALRGDANYHGSLLVEVPPGRRTITMSRPDMKAAKDGSVYKTTRYFVSFPWSYFQIGYMRETPKSRHLHFRNLHMFLSNGQWQPKHPNWRPKQRLYEWNDFPNIDGANVCLQYMPRDRFESQREMSDYVMTYFFQSAYTNDDLELPVIGRRCIKSFSEWSRYSRRIAPAHIQPDFSQFRAVFTTSRCSFV